MLNLEFIESNTQFIDTWKYFVSQCPRGEIFEIDGLAINWSNTANILFNVVFLSQPVQDEADLEAKIKLTYDYAGKYNQPWSMIICEDFLPESIRPHAPEIMSRHELVPLLKITGMAADKILPPVRPIPTLDCIRVGNLETRRAVADINAISYEKPSQLFREILEIEELWGTTVFGSVGYIKDKAVSTAATLLINRKLYVALVATLPEFRKQGYAEAVLRHSLAQAQQYSGISCTVLHATSAGIHLYQKMGYQPVADFQIYIPRSF
ncbi:GNAT family N-acetyltransferase [Scytonema sp. PCC 10023]|uniref:GNAT family N-acetyltransferase n=1 Tax=Scytonema sp. PCC 10023 TaxID=1680591 RepID=UPI0039C6442B